MIPFDPCTPNPCMFGTCSPSPGGFQCTCQPGYAGQRCNMAVDPCSSAPCRNGGTCAVIGGGQVLCLCPTGFTGDNCQNELESCGGVLDGTGNGTLIFPSTDGGLYPHQVSCAWTINTLPGKVLNVSFSRFHLETSNDCRFDWVQVNDGEDASARVVGRFCGDQTFRNGFFITTHHHLYIWFRSDHSVAGQGFQLNWNTTDPVCGGEVAVSAHGAINSPGYPGRYPANRDCTWILTAPLGKRIQFSFATLQMEHHDNCSFDFLEV